MSGDSVQRLLVGLRGAAVMLSISPRKLQGMTQQGVIHCVRLGRAVRYDVEHLREWIRRQSQGQPMPIRATAPGRSQGEH